mmetsp:Transcript_100074/g.280418  ORF Transcript_100074/g.280418 Transcript_100074/m.280418 type:complete len:289 (+) Transcript_100074:978-1844(+)
MYLNNSSKKPARKYASRIACRTVFLRSATLMLTRSLREPQEPHRSSPLMVALLSHKPMYASVRASRPVMLTLEYRLWIDVNLTRPPLTTSCKASSNAGHTGPSSSSSASGSKLNSSGLTSASRIPGIKPSACFSLLPWSSSSSSPSSVSPSSGPSRSSSSFSSSSSPSSFSITSLRLLVGGRNRRLAGCNLRLLSGSSSSKDALSVSSSKPGENDPSSSTTTPETLPPTTVCGHNFLFHTSRSACFTPELFVAPAATASKEHFATEEKTHINLWPPSKSGKTQDTSVS